jgi:hypothetical protein
MTRRNFFEQDFDDQRKEEEEKLLLDNVSYSHLVQNRELQNVKKQASLITP